MVAPLTLRRSPVGAQFRNDERHAKRRLIREDAVGQFAMVAEALTVIRRDDDERLARKRGEPIEERAKRVVRPGDLTRVRIRRITFGELVWRLVRRVWVENMHPREPFARLRPRPGECGRYDGVGAALGEREVHGTARLADAVVVGIEAGVEAEALIEREPADESAGSEAETL